MFETVAVSVIVSAAVIEYFWYRRARRKRYFELLQRQVEDAYRQTFTMSPRDVAAVKELVDGGPFQGSFHRRSEYTHSDDDE